MLKCCTKRIQSQLKPSSKHIVILLSIGGIIWKFMTMYMYMYVCIYSCTFICIYECIYTLTDKLQKSKYLLETFYSLYKNILRIHRNADGLIRSKLTSEADSPYTFQSLLLVQRSLLIRFDQWIQQSLGGCMFSLSTHKIIYM